MKKKPKDRYDTKNMTPKMLWHSDMFDRLTQLGMKKRFPKKLLESLDDIANYCGDIAMGRKK